MTTEPLGSSYNGAVLNAIRDTLAATDDTGATYTKDDAGNWADQTPEPMVPLSVVAQVLGAETGAVDPDDVGALLTAICTAAGVPAPTRYRFTQHTRPNSTGCPWSHVSVVAPDKRTEPGNRLCPDGCPASDVETDPTPDPDTGN